MQRKASKFRTRLFEAGQDELIYRMLANKNLDCNAKNNLLKDYMTSPRGYDALLAALEFAKMKRNHYCETYGYISESSQVAKSAMFEKIHVAKSVIADLKTALSVMRLAELEKDSQKITPGRKTQPYHSGF